MRAIPGAQLRGRQRADEPGRFGRVFLGWSVSVGLVLVVGRDNVVGHLTEVALLAVPGIAIAALAVLRIRRIHRSGQTAGE